MNLMKRTVVSLMISIGFLANYVQAIELCDDLGRTPLINFVIQAENEIALAKKALDATWEKYFYLQKQPDGFTYRAEDFDIPQYKYVPIRRIYTTDEDVAVYREQEKEFMLIVSMAVHGIELLVQAGADINAQDDNGYTALNYCYTQAIYNELCRQGASFQLRVWAYFNPANVAVVAMGIGVGAAAGTIIYNSIK